MHPLKKYLLEHDIEVQEFAKQIEVSREYLSMIFKGTRRPSPDVALDIEKATNGEIKAEWLIFPERYKNEIEEYLNKNCSTCEAAT